tara:strand:+ start:421 stop:2205 length:1785 start_codon:yes stop_codon:yes gene_type:complete
MNYKNLIVSNWNAKIIKDCETIYLSEYAKPESIKNRNKNKNKKEIPYHWNNKIKAEADFHYLKSLKGKLLLDLSNKLNLVNKTSLSVKSWNLILGNWLNTFLLVGYDRFYMVKKVNTKYKNLSTQYTKPFDLNNMRPLDSLGSVINFENDKWNYIFINQIINYFHQIKVIENNDKEIYISNNGKLKNQFLNFNFKKRIKELLINLVNLFLQNLGNKDKNIAFCNTNFSVFNFLFLRIFLKGKSIFEPKFHIKQKVIYQQNLRNWNLDISESDNLFETIIKKLIPEWIPIIFIEGFNKVQIQNKFIKSIKYPDIIFTVDGHFYNDPFKIWAAKCIDKGTKLAIASHLGGVPPKFHLIAEYESNVCDYYFVTGEQQIKYPQSIRISQFWNGLKFRKYNRKGKILLVTTSGSKYTRDLASFLIGEQILDSFYDQLNFFDNLPDHIKKDIRVRLYNSKTSIFNQKTFWMNNCKNISFSNNLRFSNEVSNSRLVVCAYFGRTYIELLSANIPTIIFWDTRYSKVADYCLKDFEKLKEVSIFFDNPIDASNHLNSIYNNIEYWWFSEKVQKTRFDFCQKYGYISLNKNREIASIINNCIK